MVLLKEQICQYPSGSNNYLQERLSALTSILELLPTFKVLKWKLTSRLAYVRSHLVPHIDTMKITGQSELINSQYNRDFQLDQARMAMRDKLRDIKSAAMDKLVSTLTVVFVPSTFANEDANYDRRY